MYLNKCECKEVFEPHRYYFTGPCSITGKSYTVAVSGKCLYNLRQGMHIQDAMPALSAGDREFLLTGISPEGWDQMFGDYDDEEEIVDDYEAPAF